MADPQNKIDFITPTGTSIFPRLNEPSTKFDKDGVFEVKLRLDPEDASDGVFKKKKTDWSSILERLEEMRDEFADAKREELAGASKAKDRKKAKTLEVVPVVQPDLDEETDEETGLVIIKAKMKASGTSKKTGKRWTRSPDIFDAKGKRLKNPPAIYGGTTMKVAVTAVPYYIAKDNVVGITLYMNGVQIIDLVSGSERTADAYGFGEEDGYEASDDAGTDEFDGEEDDEDDDEDF